MKKVEVSLKEILVYVLRRWKAILAFSVGVAVLGGAYGYLQQQSRSDGTPLIQFTSAEKSIPMTTLSVSIDLINYNPPSFSGYHDGIAKNEIFYKLFDRYSIVMRAAPLSEILDGIAPDGYSDEDLRQYVRVESPSAGIMNITVTEVDGINSRKAAEAIFAYLVDQTERFSNTVSEHELSLLASSSTISVADPAVDHAVESTTGSTTVASPEEVGYLGTSIMGLLVGLVLAIIASIVTYLVKLPVQIPEQIQRQLDIRYLGGVRRKRNLALADRIAGTLRMGKDDKAMEIIAANLREFAGNSKQILVTGTVAEGLIKSFSDKIKSEYGRDDVVFVQGVDINKDADTVDKLAESDAVILVERLDTSRLKRVNEEKERLDMSGKEILGYVLY